MWKGSRQFPNAKAPEKSNFVQTCNILSQYIKEKGSLKDLNLEIGGKVESLEAIVKPISTHVASTPTTMNSFRNKGKGKSAQPQPSVEKHTSLDPFPRVAMPDSCITLAEDASNKASTSKEGAMAEPKTSQLTIFYGDRVLVFDDFPDDKVRELISFAKKGSSQMSYGILANIPQEKPNSTGVIASTSSMRECPPPRAQPSSSHKAPAGISSNGYKEKTNPSSNGTMASISRSDEQLSPLSEANGSDLPIARRSSLHRFLEKRKDRAVGRGPYQMQNHQEQQPASSSKCDEQLELKL